MQSMGLELVCVLHVAHGAGLTCTSSGMQVQFETHNRELYGPNDLHSDSWVPVTHQARVGRHSAILINNRFITDQMK